MQDWSWISNDKNISMYIYTFKKKSETKQLSSRY